MIEDIKKYVENQLSEDATKGYRYHNLNHTKNVVHHVMTLGALEKVSDKEMKILTCAAWFHDLGYISDNQNHEVQSARLARKYLSEQDIEENDIKLVEDLIEVTKMDAEPETKLQMIMKDADLGHLGSDDFFKISNALRKERAKIFNDKKSKLDWAKINYDFLNNHKYYTDSAKSTFGPKKMENLKILEEKILIMETEKSSTTAQKTKKSKRSKKSKVSNIPEKGKETAYRVALRNHIQLSKIADNKANIMLSINAVIMSIIIGTILPQATDDPKLIVPFIMITLTCILSIIFATLSTRPKVTNGTVSKQDIIDKKVNLLFFGNFHTMEHQDYQDGMNFMMNDKEYLYRSLNKDLFFLGKVLYQKYKYLRLTYNCFMYGIIISTISFIVATLFMR